MKTRRKVPVWIRIGNTGAELGGAIRSGWSVGCCPGVQIIIATPGRFNDLVDRKVISLRSITFLILDEADRYDFFLIFKIKILTLSDQCFNPVSIRFRIQLTIGIPVSRTRMNTKKFWIGKNSSYICTGTVSIS